MRLQDPLKRRGCLQVGVVPGHWQHYNDRTIEKILQNLCQITSKYPKRRHHALCGGHLGRHLFGLLDRHQGQHGLRSRSTKLFIIIVIFVITYIFLFVSNYIRVLHCRILQKLYKRRDIWSWRTQRTLLSPIDERGDEAKSTTNVVREKQLKK